MSATRILLVGEPAFEDRLRGALPELNGDLRRWPGDASDLYVHRRIDDLVADAPDVVAFGPGLPAESVLELAMELDHRHPEIEVLLIASPTAKLWEHAARAGVREIVAPSSEDSELAFAV